MRKKSRNPTEKPQRRSIKDRTCEAHQNPVEAGNPEEKRRGGQSKSTKKKPPKRHKHTKTKQMQAKRKKRKAKIKVTEKVRRMSP